jgi:hypothetical protein
MNRLALAALVLAWALSAPVHAQTLAPPLLKASRPLSAPDVARVLEAAHAAMAGKTFRVTPAANVGGPTHEVQMGPVGWPRYVRSTSTALAINSSVSFVEYTGRRARSCSGDQLAEELVLGYSMVRDDRLRIFGNPPYSASDWRNEWTDDGLGGKVKAGAYAKSTHEMLSNVFDMFTTARAMSAGPFAQVEGHSARALVKPHELRPGDYSATPIPPESQEYIWLDVDSLLVVRWEMMYAGVSTGYAYTFTADPTLDMRPPAALRLIDDCVREPRNRN